MGYELPNTFKLKTVDLSDDTTIAPAGQNTQTLQPADGKIYEVIGIYVSIPDPAGSGAGTSSGR